MAASFVHSAHAAFAELALKFELLSRLLLNQFDFLQFCLELTRTQQLFLKFTLVYPIRLTWHYLILTFLLQKFRND